jgi:hypothetical protein
MEAAAGGVFTSYPTMSSGYGDFARDNQQQQTSSGYSQRKNKTMHMHENYLLFFVCFFACFIISLNFYK